jgi:sugar phosphate isomerase/epimerase
MKYSMPQWIVGDQDLETTLILLDRLGFDGIELTSGPDLCNSIKKVRGLLDKYGIEPSIIALEPFHDLSHPNESERQEAIEINKTTLNATKEVGCTRKLICGTAIGRTAAISNFAEEWKRGVESVKILAEHAAELGIQLVMEVINRYETYLIYNVDTALKFIDEVNHDNLSVMLDTYHMNIEEDDLGRAIRRTQRSLTNFHIADSNRGGVGHGHIDFFSIFKDLKEIGYDGYIGIEPMAPGPNPMQPIKTADSLKIVENYLEESIAILRAMDAAI